MNTWYRSKEEKNLRSLYGEQNWKKEQQIFQREKKKAVLLVTVLTSLLFIGLFVRDTCLEKSVADGQIRREETDYEIEVWMEAETKEKERMTLPVEKRVLTREEVEEKLEQAREILEQELLLENESPDFVQKDLYLPERLPDSLVKIAWSMDRYDVIDGEGRIFSDFQEEEGALVHLTAELKLEDQTVLYETCVRIFPKILSEAESWQQELEQAIQKEDAESRCSPYQKLPKQVQGKKIFWREAGNTEAFWIGALGLICILAVLAGKDQELAAKLRAKEWQMRMDYPEIVSKLLLFLGTGLQVKGAFGRIVGDYERKRKQGQIAERFAYEELRTAYYEIQSGVPEREAYERFGRRCQLLDYIRLSALLNQYLAKGMRGFTELLELECREAFEERKRMARKMGEEAGTKLLLPMFLMLIVVMVIIIAPAGMAMEI